MEGLIANRHPIKECIGENNEVDTALAGKALRKNIYGEEDSSRIRRRYSSLSFLMAFLALLETIIWNSQSFA